MTPYTPLFPLKREFFDLVVAGTKKVEYRTATPRWMTVMKTVNHRNRGSALAEYGRNSIAVFQCGRRIHRRYISGAEWFSSFQAASGRPCTIEVLQVVGPNAVIAFYLGDPVP